MNDSSLRPASALSTDELAELFSASYEDYQFPVRLDAAAFSAMAELSDFDLELSRIAVAGSAPVGMCLIGVRGDQGWIGGLGVVPTARRQGHGARLMINVLATAQEAGLAGASLEVLESNTAAIALYERLSFEVTRVLEVWSLVADVARSRARPERVEDAAAWIRANRRAPEPWQRADQSVGKLLRSGAGVEAVAVAGRGAALSRLAGEVASVLQLVATDAETAAELLAAIRRRGESLRFVNVPEDDPAGEALRRLGGKLEARQLEMKLGLR